MKFNIIVAMSLNRVIGINNTLPWKISGDLKHFKKLTSGKKNACLMGFNTWKSLPTFPEPLPNRGSIVITKNHKHITRSNMIYNNPDDIDFNTELYKNHYPNVWICGGEQIYKYFIDKDYIDNIYVTSIHRVIEGDTYFPEIPENYKLVEKSDIQTHKEGKSTYIGYNYEIYKNMNKKPFTKTH